MQKHLVLRAARFFPHKPKSERALFFVALAFPFSSLTAVISAQNKGFCGNKSACARETYSSSCLHCGAPNEITR